MIPSPIKPDACRADSQASKFQNIPKGIVKSLLSAANAHATITRSYDAAGRLTAVTNGTLDSTRYTLSADGRRTGSNRNGKTETSKG
jgi:YD repeat-containing protein